MGAHGLEKHAGTAWEGEGELWLDPSGNEAKRSASTMRIEPGLVRYTWAYEGAAQEGVLALGPDGATWRDSFHQPKEVACAPIEGAWGLLAVHYTYPAPEGPPWGWRIGLAERPTGELVLQMTNVAPWGEEARAVRMVFTRTP